MPIEPAIAIVRGHYRMECRKPCGRLRWARTLRNGVTFEGLNHIFNRGFRGAALSTWHTGIIAAGGFSGVSSGDTAAVHAGWTEWLGVSGGNRTPLTWNPAAGGIVSSVGMVTMVMSSTGLVRGCFMQSSLPVGNLTGVLYSTAVIDEDYDVVVADTIYLNYSALMG